MVSRRVVLVRPEGPRNVGMVLRAAANFGPADVVVVDADPRLFEHADFVAGAHGVPNPRDALTTCATLDDALAPATESIGFTARNRRHRDLVLWPEAVEPLRERLADRSETVALVFGNEKFGLSDDDCSKMTRLVWIPTTSAHTSLNLAVAVSIVLGAVFDAAPRKARSKKGRPLTHSEREFLRRHLATVLPTLISTPSTSADLRASIERVFAHAPLESRDARAWHRLLRALGSERGPADFGLQ
ncbi:MAG: RNA methyltransferase [Planctomycetes bacterium]|nr:RNA methyltransferase [Planctomycetota bacterium]